MTILTEYTSESGNYKVSVAQTATSYRVFLTYHGDRVHITTFMEGRHGGESDALADTVACLLSTKDDDTLSKLFADKRRFIH